MRPTTSWSTLVTANATTVDPASGVPYRSSARALLRSKPNRSGSGENAMYKTAAAAAPVIRPTARLIAPIPPQARPTDTRAPSHPLTWSAIILRSWRKFRSSSPTGVQTSPSSTMLSARTRMTSEAAGAPMAAAYLGAPKKQTAYMATLPVTAMVVTVGAISAGSPGQRTMARLTDRSLRLSMASRATHATA